MAAWSLGRRVGRYKAIHNLARGRCVTGRVGLDWMGCHGTGVMMDGCIVDQIYIYP